MCEPTTLAMAGLSAMGSMSAINAQNEASAANRRNALMAANDQINSSGAQYVEQNRSLIQGGFDAVLQGRQAESEAYASAIQNGVQGSSVRAMLTANKQKMNRNAQRTTQEQDSLRTQQDANFRHISNTAQGRISSVPTTSWGIGDTASMLAPIVKYEMME